MYLLKDFNSTQYANIMKKSNNCRFLIKKNRLIKLKKIGQLPYFKCFFARFYFLASFSSFFFSISYAIGIATNSVE